MKLTILFYSSVLDVWNLKTGHIIHSISLNKSEIVEDVQKSNQFCLVISSEGEKGSKKFHLTGYSVSFLFLFLLKFVSKRLKIFF
jgi:hypothetical protein